MKKIRSVMLSSVALTSVLVLSAVLGAVQKWS